MKLLFCAVAAFIAICVQAPETHALVGPQGSVGTRGGGNTVGAEFADLANSSVIKLGLRLPVTVNGFKIDALRLLTTVKKMKVFTVDYPLILNGKVVQAVNDPQAMEITFNQTAWVEMSLVDRTQLVLHELIGLTFPEISDEGYLYSRRLLEHVNIYSKTPDQVDIQGWLTNSAVVKGITSGVEVEYQVTCEAYQVVSYEILSNDRGVRFQAKAYCYSKNPAAESGAVITIDGAGDELSVGAGNIKIDLAG